MEGLVEIKENWETIKEKLKQKWGILTDTDVRWMEGKYEDMLYKLNIILGVTIVDLKKFIAASITPEEKPTV